MKKMSIMLVAALFVWGCQNEKIDSIQQKTDYVFDIAEENQEMARILKTLDKDNEGTCKIVRKVEKVAVFSTSQSGYDIECTDERTQSSSNHSTFKDYYDRAAAAKSYKAQTESLLKLYANLRYAHELSQKRQTGYDFEKLMESVQTNIEEKSKLYETNMNEMRSSYDRFVEEGVGTHSFCMFNLGEESALLNCHYQNMPVYKKQTMFVKNLAEIHDVLTDIHWVNEKFVDAKEKEQSLSDLRIESLGGDTNEPYYGYTYVSKLQLEVIKDMNLFKKAVATEQKRLEGQFELLAATLENRLGVRKVEIPTNCFETEDCIDIFDVLYQMDPSRFQAVVVHQSGYKKLVIQEQYSTYKSFGRYRAYKSEEAIVIMYNRDKFVKFDSEQFLVFADAEPAFDYEASFEQETGIETYCSDAPCYRPLWSILGNQELLSFVKKSFTGINIYDIDSGSKCWATKGGNLIVNAKDAKHAFQSLGALKRICRIHWN